MPLSRRASRNYIPCAADALCPTSFAAHLILFFAFVSSHPHEPDARLGLVYPLNSHGSYVYISAVESTGLALLLGAFVVCLVVTIAVTPKQPVLPPPGTPRWLTYVSGAAKTDLGHPTRSMWAVFLAAVVIDAAFIFLAGPWISGLLVGWGFILHWG